MKMFEYMACGLPVLGSNVGQIAEIIEPGRNGMLFENTPEALRACLLKPPGQRTALKTMGANARADVVDRYNWREVARRTVETFEAAIAERRPGGIRPIDDARSSPTPCHSVDGGKLPS
jgi:glycosyltransferase involved in cell wall biosynthesis